MTRAALLGLACYVLGMLWVTSRGRAEVYQTRGKSIGEFMVGPTALRPWEREVVIPGSVGAAEGYIFGRYRLGGGISWTDSLRVGSEHPAVAAVLDREA